MSTSPLPRSDADRGRGRAEAMRIKLGTARILAFMGLGATLWLGTIALRAAAANGVDWQLYVATLLPMLFLFHACPLWRLTISQDHVVRASGNGWTIGRYSEADLREIADDVAARLPRKWPPFRVFVGDVRQANAWTWIESFWPLATGWRRVDITRGALHYLTRDEMTALLLHEAAHHQP